MSINKLIRFCADCNEQLNQNDEKWQDLEDKNKWYCADCWVNNNHQPSKTIPIYIILSEQEQQDFPINELTDIVSYYADKLVESSGSQKLWKKYGNITFTCQVKEKL